MSKKIKAWYFSKKDCRLRYGDGRKCEVGVTHTVDCEPILCKQGLHASTKVLDALRYAPGNICWLVELSGKIVIGGDKCVATERTYLKKFDSKDMLREFARECAMEVLPLWNAPDVVVEYLKTGDADIRAAAYDDAADAAAYDAADAAVYAAVYAAAYDAAYDAAADAAADAAVYAAAYDAAYDAAADAADAAAAAVAYDAAVYAAYDASYNDAFSKFNKKLEDKMLKAMGEIK